MNFCSWQYVISNGVALINAGILIYTFLQSDKNTMLKIQSVSMALLLLTYAVSECWASVIANSISIIRNLYNSRNAKPRTWVNALILTVAVAVSIAANNGTVTGLLPIISLVFYSLAVMKLKSSVGLKVVTCMDMLLWLVYDFKNMLVICVVSDLVALFMLLASSLLAYMDKKDRESTEAPIVI